MTQQTSERALLFHIKRAWEQINYQLFNQRLTSPSFTLLSGGKLLGSWKPRERIISLQKEMVYSSPWLEVLEVLKHEMAHQYVSEFLKVEGESAHGPSFRKVCSERSIDFKSGGHVNYDPSIKKLLAKVNKLLALAESDNSYEAEQAAQRAQQLLLKHHIQLGQESPDITIDYEYFNVNMGFKQLGIPKSRRYQYEYGIANLLSEHFFVSAIWVSAYSVKEEREGRVLEICGRHEDLEIASYVYDFIHNHLKLAWETYRREKNAKGLKKRLSFSLGLVQGFSAQFQRYEADHDEDTRALIHIGKSVTQEYLACRYPKISQRRSSSWSPSGDYHQGYREGHALHLRRGVKAERGQSGEKLKLELNP